MSLTVRQKADCIATYRYLSEFAMELLARWVPTTPELEVKVLFGRHLWDFAQHADGLGHRTAELRLGMHANRPPTDALGELLERVGGLEDTGDRIVAVYEWFMPVLDEYLQWYLDETDMLMDEPSIRIIERIRWDYERMFRDLAELRGERSDITAAHSDLVQSLRVDTPPVTDAVDFRPVPSDTAAAV